MRRKYGSIFPLRNKFLFPIKTVVFGKFRSLTVKRMHSRFNVIRNTIIQRPAKNFRLPKGIKWKIADLC